MPAGVEVAHRPGERLWDPAGPGFGVYVHIPFCASRCDYCSFAAWDDRTALAESYVEGLRRELALAGEAGLPSATSVFFGGGTPSLIPAESLCSVLGDIELAPGCEITVECNPEDVDDHLAETYATAGVNRLSFGVQSMADHVLVSLGRRHRLASVQSATAAARRQGFESFNLDLIYGAVGETLEDWRRTLEAVLELEPPHVSAYALTVEAGTPLAAQPDRHPDDDDQAAKYELAEEMLTAGGLAWYEISNWSRPGHECAHNRLYWRQGDYLGIGASAHSHASGRRWWNVRTPERYLEIVSSGRLPVAAGEDLDPPTRALEAEALAIRTRSGVAQSVFDPADLQGPLDGLVETVGDRVVLTLRGRLLANEVSMRLNPEADQAAR